MIRTAVLLSLCLCALGAAASGLNSEECHGTYLTPAVGIEYRDKVYLDGTNEQSGSLASKEFRSFHEAP